MEFKQVLTFMKDDEQTLKTKIVKTSFQLFEISSIREHITPKLYKSKTRTELFLKCLNDWIVVEGNYENLENTINKKTTISYGKKI